MPKVFLKFHCGFDHSVRKISKIIPLLFFLLGEKKKVSAHLVEGSIMEDKAPTVDQLSSGLGGPDPEVGIETVDIERIERVYR